MFSHYPIDRNFLQRKIDVESALDYGPHPFVIDLKNMTLNNENYRIALWSGNHLQLTLMSIPVDQDIGLEMHPHVDQFLYVEDGVGKVLMGKQKDHLNQQYIVFENSAIFIPAMTWHNIINIGKTPLKLFSIYAPMNHPWGTIQETKEIAQKEEN